MFLKKQTSRLRECPPPVPAQGIEKVFARLFATQDGKKVLGYLCGLTFMRASGPDAAAEILRHQEGQRALMLQILRLIDHGK